MKEWKAKRVGGKRRRQGCKIFLKVFMESKAETKASGKLTCQMTCCKKTSSNLCPNLAFLDRQHTWLPYGPLTQAGWVSRVWGNRVARPTVRFRLEEPRVLGLAVMVGLRSNPVCVEFQGVWRKSQKILSLILLFCSEANCLQKLSFWFLLSK